MRILYFGFYKPSYPRNQIILQGLRENGVEVIECNERSLSFLRYIRLAVKFFKMRKPFDVMIVGFPGQEAMFLARLLTRKPIIFDVFTSHYMGYILDRQYFSPTSWRAKYYRFVDYWSCRLADIVFLDTQAHIDFFTKEFNLPANKFFRVFLGAKSDVFQPLPPHASGGSFNVVFWGNFIPLQGAQFIVQAAHLLKDEPIHFYLIGRGQTLAATQALAEKLDVKNISFPGRISSEELLKYIENADVCLGTFSGNEKADITIQNKIFEAIASRRPILTSRTKALEELFKDSVNCLLCNPADARDLADKILMLKNDTDLRNRIAEGGYQLFRERLSEKQLGSELLSGIKSRMKHAGTH